MNFVAVAVVVVLLFIAAFTLISLTGDEGSSGPDIEYVGPNTPTPGTAS